MGSIGGMAVEGLLFSSIGVAAITAISTANTTGWNSIVVGLMYLIPLAMIVGGVLIMFDKAGFKIRL